MRKGLAGFLVMVMVIAMIPVLAEVKPVQAAITTEIILPYENSLVAAGYVKISWKEASGSVKNYQVYVDGQKVTTTTKTEYEYYTTQVRKFQVSVKTVYTNGSSVSSETRNFYVTKKGLAVNEVMGEHLSPLEMNMGWYYTWGTNEFSHSTYSFAQFVPMQWGTGNEENNINTAVSRGYRYFLGYNEPDMGGDVGGSNMSVQTALSNWTKLCGKDIHLGSPAPALCPAWSNGSWFRSFMDSVDQNSFEFIPLHCYYGTYGGAEAANTFLTEVVDGTWNMYHKPIWVTEFAINGWGISDEYGKKKVKEFMEAVIEGLNEREYVERYSWFSFNTTDGYNSASALWTNATGELTDLGRTYVNNGNPAGYDYQVALESRPYTVSISDRNALLPDSVTIKNATYEDLITRNGVSVTASSELGNNKATGAIDNSISSRWESVQKVDPQSITIDFGETRNIKQVDIVWEGASAAQYSVDVSEDGVNYESVATVSSSRGARWDCIRFSKMQSARYVKINGTSRTTPYGYSIYDLAIYGTDAVDPKMQIQMHGYQISTTHEGYRVVCSVEPEIGGKNVESYGVVYAIEKLNETTNTGVTEEDLVVNSNNPYVKSYAAVPGAILNAQYSQSDTAINYAQVMKFGRKNIKAFQTIYAVRAYAKLEDGTYVYSNMKSTSVAYLADYIYSRQLINNYSAHQYLYKEILKVVNPDYKEIAFDWSKTKF